MHLIIRDAPDEAARAMIDNGVISLPSRDVLQTWQPSSSIISALLVATLTTLLSFHVAAAVTDVILGCKPRGHARVSAMEAHLLRHKASPLTLLRALLPSSFHPGHNPSQDRSPNDDRARFLSSRTVIKLLLLLVVSPMANIAAITLTLETDTILTFRDVNFVGAALGAALMPQKVEPVSESCQRAPIDLPEEETAVVQFVICQTRHETQMVAVGESKDQAFVDVTAFTDGSVGIGIVSPLGEVRVKKMAHLVTGLGKDFRTLRVGHMVGKEAAYELARFGGGLLAQWCGGEEDVKEEELQEAQVGIRRGVRCVGRGEVAEIAEIASNISARVGIVESDGLRVAETIGISEQGEVTFFEGGSLNFVKRRDRKAGVLVLVILFLVALAVRCTVLAVTNNDVAQGIGLMVRDELGLRGDSSMLACSDVWAVYRRGFNQPHREDDEELDRKGGRQVYFGETAWK